MSRGLRERLREMLNETFQGEIEVKRGYECFLFVKIFVFIDYRRFKENEGKCFVYQVDGFIIARGHVENIVRSLTTRNEL